MKPWIRRTLLGLFGATIVLGGATACSHYGHHGWHASAEEQARFHERMVDRVADRLDLNPAQKAKLATLATILHQQRMALRGAADPRTQVQALVSGEKFDRAKAQALVGEKTSAINERSPEVIAAAGDFYDSLDPQQQARVREYLQHRRGWWRRG